MVPTGQDISERAVKWASITLHPDLPSKAIQVGGARAWGAVADWLAGMDVSTTFTDDVMAIRTTKWTLHLEQRAALLDALSIAKSPLAQVFFRSPMCLGFSEKHLIETAEAIWATNAMIYVQTLDVLLRPGDSLADVIEPMERERKAAGTRRYRAKKST
ncbi:hypothetical protein D2T29_12425 [Sinirhodobacter populi]|uniref:Uncharacterized protein n=1 Tax=Paenirhodobacter populi TaxID=2306993 RepID=A0A443KCI7_9RHOB|nr:hypothetical protein [Sinirhodobacter populi]RWR30470.1 hypothetical protein D2T29_12425 [Sinirhodobacter populi]